MSYDICVPGYWTNEVEAQAAKRVAERAPFLSHVIKNKDQPDISSELRTQIYKKTYAVLKLLNNSEIYPEEKLTIKQACQLTALPKSNDKTVSPKIVNLYHVVPQDFPQVNYFFIADQDGEIIAEMRLQPQRSNSYLQSIYGDSNFFAVESIETYDTSKAYSFGSILIQTAIEFSIDQGCSGRLALFSVEHSGQFYHKLGFLPQEESLLMFLNACADVDGNIMFLPNDSLKLWVERMRENSVLSLSQFKETEERRSQGLFRR